MQVKIICKDAFSVIGKSGQGPSSKGREWIPKIWEDANGSFHLIADIVKYNKDGSLYGLWGVMSDTGMKFERWGEYGAYLAGCEVETDTVPPEGFTKWDIPGRKYLVADASLENYFKTFSDMINEYIPENGYQIIGAVHEKYTHPGTNEIELYFPIDIMDK